MINSYEMIIIIKGDSSKMFGFRPDGKKVKNVAPVFKIIPSIMLDRNDSQVFFKQDIPLKNMEAYISQKAEEGIKLSYMTIIYSAIVRIIAERPQLNWFAMNGTLYERDKVYVSLAIKKSLSDEGEETNIKLPFTGKETIFDIKETLDAVISENKKTETENDTDKFVNFVNLIPNFLVRWIVKLLGFLDKYGLLPRKLIDISPFHTSAYVTNVGSLGIDTIYHHLYNFGTTSMFFAMGKKKKSYVYEDDEIQKEKCITIAFVGDERICDGYYYANSFKQLLRYLKKPALLEVSPDEKEKKEEDKEIKKEEVTV